jgi:hypothetical protein
VTTSRSGSEVEVEAKEQEKQSSKAFRLGVYDANPKPHPDGNGFKF